MSLQVKLALEGNLEKFSKDVSGKLAAAVRSGIEGYARRVQLKLRDDVREGGLGDRVANAWRLNLYSDDPNAPAALVYSKAPLIVTAFGADTTVVPHSGHLYLAIPTENVPKLGGHRMTPNEVEVRFNQKLVYRPSRAGNALAFVNQASRRGTRSRIRGSATKLMLMFVMVRQVHLRQRLHWATIMTDAKAGFETFLADTVAQALAD